MKIFWKKANLRIIESWADGVPSDLYWNPEDWEIAMLDFPYVHMRVRKRSFWNRFLNNQGLELKKG